MRVVAIVQARMGSTRLPGKVLNDLCGQSVLSRVIERLRVCRQLADILVATTDESADEPIIAECRRIGVPVSRGDEKDVLNRYYRAAQFSKAETIVRITSDCPLIDPEVTDKTISAFLDASPDYASNCIKRTYPRGLDTEVMSMDALARAWRQAMKPYEREHVTPYIYGHPQDFKLLSVEDDQDQSSHRWTLDTVEDLKFMQAIYGNFRDTRFDWRDVISYLETCPEIIELNRSVRQKGLHEG